MTYGGRERRRTDLYGRLRRLMYGVMLWTAVPAAHAADETGGRRFHDLLSGLNSSIAGLAQKRLAFMQPEAAPEEDLLLRPESSVRTLLSFRFEDELTTLRKGAGFDLAPPEMGYMYINLVQPKDAAQRGRRWKLYDERTAQNPARAWQIGGTVDLVRDDPHGSKEVNVNPQLLLDLDAILGMSSKCEGRVQYANWKGNRNVEDNRALGRVVQVTVQWRF